MWKQYCIFKVLLALQEHQKPSNVTICCLKMKSGFCKILVQKLGVSVEVTTSVNKGRAVDVIYLDFCKAFYMVPHNILHRITEW